MNARRPAPFFIGDDLAIDFLNSIATPVAEPVEWIASGEDLLTWLEIAGALPKAAAAHLRASCTTADLDDVARRARDLREWFRGFIRRRSGEALGPRDRRALEPLDAVLRLDAGYARIVAIGGTLRLERERHWNGAASLLLPLAEAMATLAVERGLARVRPCEGSGCTLWFHDSSKAHRRRWCSMAACGNRAKAAGFRARESAASDATTGGGVEPSDTEPRGG